MALGEIQWLQWKSKSTRERDAKEYEAWAFPFGEEQKEKIIQILHELLPKEEKSIALVCYLTAKEIASKVHQIYNIAAHREFAYKSIAQDLKRYKRMFKPRETSYLYCALALIDLDMTRELNYPTIDEIRDFAANIEKEILAINEK